MTPETRYAKSGTVSIAYQVVGDGPIDLVMVPGFISNVEIGWEEPNYAKFLMRLAAISRLILFDKRGTGLSDRVAEIAPLEVRMDDVRAVMDAAGSQRAAVFGISEGGSMSALFASTYPDRTSALITAGSFARACWAPDYEWGVPLTAIDAMIAHVEQEWGSTARAAANAPSMANDPDYVRWYGRHLRMGASPASAAMIIRMTRDIDIRHLLPAIRVPTLVLHGTRDAFIDVRHGRYMAARIPDAKLVELNSPDHFPWLTDTDTAVSAIADFLAKVRADAEPDRVLATVLFTDIVGATEKAASLGDRGWHGLLDQHHAAVRRNLARFRGREIDNAGDGFLAAFDGPARAVRCACAISDEMRPLGLEIRAGLHTGECEVMGEKLGGIAVHTGARVAALAGAGEVLVSSTVKDLVAGSGLSFSDRGAKSLKGVPGEWRLYAVERSPAS
ncbi:MAG TPA: adenylate/guanylate cyclase domain-containing protein [Stellaceae bacterium]|nr:adenylate/guanylate cyclase domain-containing protein [Stellaceae bacterium]